MNTANSIARIALAAGLLASFAVLSGCGRGGDNPAPAAQGQVVAHLGNDVITTQELENELRLNNIPADKQKDPPTLKRILGELAARKYLARQALASKLDREPGVLLDILRSKEQVLANAAMSRSVTARVSALSNTDLEKYIANNPTKFANRRIMEVEQVAFAIGPNLQTILDAARDVKSLDEIDQKLTGFGVPHNRSMGSINSAEIPENLLNQMQTKKANDVFFLRAGNTGVFLVVKNEEVKPLTGEAALNVARQALRADLLKSEIGMASVAANLEAKYEGEYASVMGQDPKATAK